MVELFALYINIQKLKRKAEELHIHIRYLVLQHKLVWDPQIRPLAVARDKECPLKLILIRLLMNVTWGSIAGLYSTDIVFNTRHILISSFTLASSNS